MISVLLPCRDAATTVRAAAESVLADMALGDELVVIDDASRDGSADVVRAIGDPRVVLVDGAGGGIAKALALGLASSRGDFIARMDADDVSLPSRLEKSRVLLERDPSLGAVAVQVEAFGGPAAGLARYLAWQNALIRPHDHACMIYVETPLCHPATMFRRSAIDAVGGFRDLPWPEDWDLFLRLHHAGFALAKVPEILFRWRRTGTNVTSTDPRCALPRLVALRAHYLAKILPKTFGVWGAGKTGRHLARALARDGAHASFFVDIDPRKIGRTAYGKPILSPEEGVARGQKGTRLVIAVGAPGARDIVRTRLSSGGLVEGSDFLSA